MLILFSGGIGLSAFAATETKTLSMYCFDQYYITFPPDAPKPGAWTTGMGKPRSVVLTKDPNYPNPSYLGTVWTGQHDEKLNGGDFHLDISARELNGNVEYLNTISVTIDGITAESDGGSYIRAALKTKNKSSGAIYSEMKLQ